MPKNKNAEYRFMILDRCFSDFRHKYNIEDLLDAVAYATGYVVFSTNVKHAKECAAKLVDYGFRNVYYCIDNILDYPKYFEYTERQLEVDETSNETPAP